MKIPAYDLRHSTTAIDELEDFLVSKNLEVTGTLTIRRTSCDVPHTFKVKFTYGDEFDQHTIITAVV